MTSHKSTVFEQPFSFLTETQTLPPFICPLCKTHSPTISKIFIDIQTNIPCISYKCKCTQSSSQTQIVSLPHLLLYLNEIKPKCFQHSDIDSIIYCPICKIYMCKACQNYHLYFKKEHALSNTNHSEYTNQIYHIQKHLTSMFTKFNIYIKKEITIINEMIDKMTKLKSVIEQNQMFIYDTNSYLIKFLCIVYNDYYNLPELNTQNVRNLILKSNLVLKTDTKFLDKVILNFNKIIKAFNLQQKDISHRMVIDLEEEKEVKFDIKDINNNEGINNNNAKSYKGTLSTNDNTNNNNLYYGSVGSGNHINNTTTTNEEKNCNLFRIKKEEDNYNSIHTYNYINGLNIFSNENYDKQCVFDYNNQSNSNGSNNLNIIPVSPSFSNSMLLEHPKNNNLSLTTKFNHFDSTNTIPSKPTDNPNNKCTIKNNKFIPLNSTKVQNKNNPSFIINDLNILPISSQTCLYSLSNHISTVTSVIQLNHYPKTNSLNHPNLSSSILTSSLDTTIIFYNPSTFQLLSTIPTINSGITTLAELTNGSLIIAFSNNSIRLYSFKTNKYEAILTGHTSIITSLLQFDHNTILSSSHDCTIKIWDIMKKKCIKILNTGSSKINALLLINSTSFASCGEDGIIQIWSLNKSSSYQFKIIKKMNGHDGKVNCLCKVDENIIASGGSDGCIRIWNVGSGICVGVLMGHCGGVNMVIKSGVSDNERIVLVSVSDDKSVKMWNVNQRKCVGEIENAHDGKVKIVKEIEDGKIVTAGDNGIVKVWV